VQISIIVATIQTNNKKFIFCFKIYLLFKINFNGEALKIVVGKVFLRLAFT